MLLDSEPNKNNNNLSQNGALMLYRITKNLYVFK